MSSTHTSALSMHTRYPVIDVHSHWLINGHYLGKHFQKRHKPPWLWNPLRNMLDLPRLREGRVACSTFTVYVPVPPLRWSAWAACCRIMDTFDALVMRNQQELVKVESELEIRKAHAQGKLAALLAVEGGHVIGRRLERLELLRKRGVRMLTLTHLFANRICDAHVGPGFNKGLSKFGREVALACEALGIVVDLAHASERAYYQVLDLLDRPPVVTHTGLRQGRRSARYLSDDQVKALAQKGGALGMMLCPWYHKRRSILAGLDQVVDGFVRVAELVGAEHLMIGSDMDGYIWLPRGMRDAADMLKLTEKLMEKGFSEHELAQILGENALRILSAWE